MTRLMSLTFVAVLSLAACGGRTPTSTAGPTNSPATTSADSPTVPVTATSPNETATATTTAYTVGDRVRFGDHQFHVVAEVEWWESDNQFIEPAPDSAFLTWLVRLEGIDPEGSSYNPFNYKLRGPDGFEYNPTIGRQPRLSSGELDAGATVQGWLTFEVTADGGSYQLLWRPSILEPGVAISADLAAP